MPFSLTGCTITSSCHLKGHTLQIRRALMAPTAVVHVRWQVSKKRSEFVSKLVKYEESRRSVAQATGLHLLWTRALRGHFTDTRIPVAKAGACTSATAERSRFILGKSTRLPDVL